MTNFNVALLQILPTGSQEANLIKGLEYCKKAKQIGADIALFPEMWNIGYALTPDREEIERNAVGLDSDYIARFQELAIELNIAVGITFLEKYDPSPRNSLAVIDRHGKIVLLYAKLHTCIFDAEERWLTAGDDFYVVDLNTENGTVKIGSMICYDREQPESARILMLKGAEIILVPNACPMEINRLTQLRARAYENMVGIATVNYPQGQPDCNGHSSAFDGIAYKSESSSSSDMMIVDAGEAEGIYMAGFPIDELREYRKREIHGNAYRHPDKYHLILSKEKAEPFIREVFEAQKQCNDNRIQFYIEKESSQNTIKQFVSVIRAYAGEHFTDNFADDVAIDAPYQRLCYLVNNDELISGLMFTCLDGYPHITAMATKREYQGRGHGKKLINHFVNYVSQLGFHDIELYAWSEKTRPICASTQAFYKSAGFVIEQEYMGLWARDMITVKMKKSW